MYSCHYQYAGENIDALYGYRMWDLLPYIAMWTVFEVVSELLLPVSILVHSLHLFLLATMNRWPIICNASLWCHLCFLRTETIMAWYGFETVHLNEVLANPLRWKEVLLCVLEWLVCNSLLSQMPSLKRLENILIIINIVNDNIHV